MLTAALLIDLVKYIWNPPQIIHVKYFVSSDACAAQKLQQQLHHQQQQSEVLKTNECITPMAYNSIIYLSDDETCRRSNFDMASRTIAKKRSLSSTCLHLP